MKFLTRSPKSSILGFLSAGVLLGVGIGYVARGAFSAPSVRPTMVAQGIFTVPPQSLIASGALYSIPSQQTGINVAAFASGVGSIGSHLRGNFEASGTCRSGSSCFTFRVMIIKQDDGPSWKVGQQYARVYESGVGTSELNMSATLPAGTYYVILVNLSNSTEEISANTYLE